VDQSLKDSLQQSAKVAGESMLPALENALAGMSRESQGMHERLVTTWSSALAEQEKSQAQWVTQVSQSLASFSITVDQRSQSLVSDVRDAQAAHQLAQAAREDERLQAWQAALTSLAAGLEQTAHTLSSQAQANARQLLEETSRLVGASEALIQTRIDTESQWASLHGQRMDQMASVLKTELSALRDEEALRGQAAVARLAELETALATHLTTLGTALEAPITRLIHTASEAPRAAAEVIGKLREEVSNSVARDNELLEERSRILETLNALLNSIHHASTEQRAVIDSLVASSAVALDQAGSQLAERMASQTDKLSGTTAQLNGSAIEVAALSEALVFAVKAFGEANDKLIGNMERIEKAIDQSMTRSDEQLAYYVAQAREVIDLSIASHKDIFDELRKLPSAPSKECCCNSPLWGVEAMKPPPALQQQLACRRSSSAAAQDKSISAGRVPAVFWQTCHCPCPWGGAAPAPQAPRAALPASECWEREDCCSHSCSHRCSHRCSRDDL
jgi:ABC-type transporter Mla subunit MlaD